MNRRTFIEDSLATVVLTSLSPQVRAEAQIFVPAVYLSLAILPIF